MICSNCGKPVPQGKKFCIHCGARLEVPQPVPAYACTNCGAPLDTGASFCTRCGARTVSTEPEPASEPLPETCSPEPEPVQEACPPEPMPEPEPAFEREPVFGPLCAACGAALRPGLRFCTSCGAKTDGQAPVSDVPQGGRCCPSCGAAVEAGLRFCSDCGTPVEEGAAFMPPYPPYPPQKRRRRRKRRLIWLWILLFGLLLAGAGGYWLVQTNYADAISGMRAMDFAAAQSAMDKTLIGDLLFADDVALIDAGLEMEKGAYDQAIEAFSALGDYENAAECLNEAKYRKAEKLLKARAYDEAAELFESLGKYRDSRESAQRARVDAAVAHIGAGQDAEAITALQTLIADGNPYAQQKLDEIVVTLYEKACVLYREGDYSAAKLLFSQMIEHERSDDYLRLIEAHELIENASTAPYDTSALANDYLRPLIGLEDAADMVFLDKRVAYAFLHDDWSSDDGEYFRMTYNISNDSYNVRYNLPYFAEDGTFYFEGNVWLERSSAGAVYETFRFTLLDEDLIQIYAFRDGKTYTLMRD